MQTTISTSDSYQIKLPSSDDGAMPDSFTLGPDHVVPAAAVDQFWTDGVVCLRNVMDEATIDALRVEADEAVEEGLDNPGPDVRFVKPEDGPGVFMYKFNTWRQQPAMRSMLFESHFPDIGAALMRSKSVTLHYTNTFVKDGGASETPWHEDASYSRMMGKQVMSIFLAYDHMPGETTIKYKQGSHLRDEPVYMGSTFQKGEEYGAWMDDHIPMPSQEELDARFRTIYWEVSPGDALAFTQRTLHGAPSNTLSTRRHATAFNLIGDDVAYDARLGPVDSPGGLDPNISHGAHPAGKRFPKLR